MRTHSPDLTTSLRTRPAWATEIGSLLDEVDIKLNELVMSDIASAQSIGMRLFGAGGKRVRPALVILSALATDANADPDRCLCLSAAAELLHSASLIHDDVVDETYERRGRSTANSTHGNKLSVLGGDFLLSKSFGLLAADSDPEMMRVLASVATAMSEAEMLQVACEGDVEMWQKHYWKVIEGKTAAFMGACCECGSIIASPSADSRRELKAFGIALGLAFQITDDLLDFIGDPLVTGKRTGVDIAEGKYTLPVLLALQDAKTDDLANMLVSPSSEEDFERISAIIEESGSISKARTMALRQSENAIDRLSVIPDSKYRRSLELLCESVVVRIR